jgi:hypothetical protein
MPHMVRACISACLFATIATASPAPQHKGGPVNKGPGSLAAARKYLEGRWSLTSFEVFPPGGSALRLKGTGTLVYDQFGNLDVEVRVDEATARALESAGISTTNGVFSTSGRTAIDLQRQTLTYVLKDQPPPGAPSGPLALNRPRYWQVEDDVLTLTTKGDDGHPLSVGRWTKVR